MADPGKQLGEGIRLILEELKDLKRELLKYSQSADEDRKQAAVDRRRADGDRGALMAYIRQIGEVDRVQRQDPKVTQNALVQQNARLAEILDRHGDLLGAIGGRLEQHTGLLGEIRDLLRRGGSGRPPHHGNGHGKR